MLLKRTCLHMICSVLSSLYFSIEDTKKLYQAYFCKVSHYQLAVFHSVYYATLWRLFIPTLFVPTSGFLWSDASTMVSYHLSPKHIRSAHSSTAHIWSMQPQLFSPLIWAIYLHIWEFRRDCLTWSSELICILFQECIIDSGHDKGWGPGMGVRGATGYSTIGLSWWHTGLIVNFEKQSHCKTSYLISNESTAKSILGVAQIEELF